MVLGRSNPRRGEKSVSPSRARYEKANPTVSVRVSSELREWLTMLKEVHDLSIGDVLRIGLEKAKPDLAAARTRGFAEGYEMAREKYEVTYWCSCCRPRHLSILSQEAKEDAAKMMCEAGWHSSSCS